MNALRLLEDTVKRVRGLCDAGHTFRHCRVTVVTEEGNFIEFATGDAGTALPLPVTKGDVELIRKNLRAYDASDEPQEAINAQAILDDIEEYLRGDR